MSVLFDLPTSLQLEIASSWLNFPQMLRDLVNFDGAIFNKSMRESLKEMYEGLTWDGYFSCDSYNHHDPAPKIRWLTAREIRFTQLNLARFKTDSKVFEDFLVANGRTLKMIKLRETKSAMSNVMKYIAAHCSVLETLWLENCNVTQPLALVLKKCTTLKELRLRSANFKWPDEQNHSTEKVGIFAKVSCPSVTRLAILHPISLSEMAAMVAAFPNVVELELKGQKYNKPVLLALSAWNRLEVLDMQYWNLITEEVCAALEQSAHTLRKLTFASFSENVAVGAFEKALSKCEKLVAIHFETDARGDLISVIAKCCGPRLLHLYTPHRADFPSAAAHALAEHCPNLRTLSSPTLAGCEDHALILQNCIHLENLHVDLRHRVYGPENHALLQSIITHCTNLQQVSFENGDACNITIELSTIIDRNKKLRVIGVDPYCLQTYPAALLSKAKFVHSYTCRGVINP